MNMIDWKVTEEKLKSLMGEGSKLDVYMVINVLRPLRNRFLRGERSLRLYNLIMKLDARALMEGTVIPRREAKVQPQQRSLPIETPA